MKNFSEYLAENEEMTRQEIVELEKYLDGVFKKVGIDIEFTRHFLDRVNDKRNKNQITKKELLDLYKMEYVKYAKEIASKKDNFQAVLNDKSSKINIPFALNWNKRTNMMELVAKTVMRKANFRTSNTKYVVQT